MLFSHYEEEQPASSAALATSRGSVGLRGDVGMAAECGCAWRITNQHH